MLHFLVEDLHLLEVFALVSGRKHRHRSRDWWFYECGPSCYPELFASSFQTCGRPCPGCVRGCVMMLHYVDVAPLGYRSVRAGMVLSLELGPGAGFVKIRSFRLNTKVCVFP